MRRLSLVLPVIIVSLAVAWATTSARSQAPARSWPQRTVKLIVPISPGTATDVTARLYADKLSLLWGKPVVVENRPGPDALVAVNAFVGAHDDHTLMFSFGAPVTANPVMISKLSYDPDRDLVPIVSASDSFLAFAVNANLKINSLQELAQRARAEPGKLNWASTPGMPQFAFAGLVTSAHLDMVQVSYRDFNLALQDVAEGRITAVSTGLLGLLPLAQSGKVRIIAVTSRQRAPAAPQIPTTTEAGFPGAVAEGFQGFFGWRDMPVALRDQIAADVRKVAPDLPAERLAHLGQVVRVGTTADFEAMLADQRAHVAAVVKAGGVKPR